MEKTINKEELIGKVFYLDMGSLSPIEVEVIGVDGDMVKVKYLNSYQNRVEIFNIGNFCYFANITIE